MRIGITGAYGFIGWHLRCFLKTQSDIEEIRLAGRETFLDNTGLMEFVVGLDAIIHLAGVNRAEQSELLDGNVRPTAQLLEALYKTRSKPLIVFASSTYAEQGSSVYGQGKHEASTLIADWARETEGRFTNAIIPHVFGEYGRPFYNSAVATFCHQITRGESLTIDEKGKLELVHAQDLVEQLLEIVKRSCLGEVRIKGDRVSVLETVARLQALYSAYNKQQRMPDLSEKLQRNLFNTLRAYIPAEDRLTTPVQHVDERGWLIEAIKTGSGGQCFVSTTKPGIVRGNHFHRRKVERFFVLQGKARIQLRKLFTKVVISYDLDGKTPSYIDIPTLSTHSIVNTGENELTTLFWADEIFNPDKADTYFEPVVEGEQ